MAIYNAPIAEPILTPKEYYELRQSFIKKAQSEGVDVHSVEHNFRISSSFKTWQATGDMPIDTIEKSLVANVPSINGHKVSNACSLSEEGYPYHYFFVMESGWRIVLTAYDVILSHIASHESTQHDLSKDAEMYKPLVGSFSSSFSFLDSKILIDSVKEMITNLSNVFHEVVAKYDDAAIHCYKTALLNQVGSNYSFTDTEVAILMFLGYIPEHFVNVIQTDNSLTFSYTSIDDVVNFVVTKLGDEQSMILYKGETIQRIGKIFAVSGVTLYVANKSHVQEYLIEQIDEFFQDVVLYQMTPITLKVNRG